MNTKDINTKTKSTEAETPKAKVEAIKPEQKVEVKIW